MCVCVCVCVCAQNIYVATTGDIGVCRIFMLLPQVTLVCVQNIYVATTGDIGVCAEYLCCYHR